MKPFLRDFAANIYSQLGEDGMIERLFADIGVQYRTCVEFGAWDGLFCSNTAHLWRDQGWKSIQIEPNPERYAQLVETTAGYDVITRSKAIVRSNMDESITGIGQLDLLSIDIDGDDYYLFEVMNLRPRVVVLEFNQSIPPHLDLRHAAPGESRAFGASALAVKRLAEHKGYVIAGRSENNLFLVEGSEPDPSQFYNTDWDQMFSWDEYTYVVTDATGEVAMLGHGPYWGYATHELTYPLRVDGEKPPWRKYLEFG